MVIRFWRGRARPDNANAYRTHFATAVLPKLRRIDGFVSAQLLERRSGDLVEFLVMTEWASWDAIHLFAGEEPGRAVVDPDAQRVLVDYDSTVDHFERARLE